MCDSVFDCVTADAPKLAHETFRAIKPGLSAYADDPQKVRLLLSLHRRDQKGPGVRGAQVQLLEWNDKQLHTKSKTSTKRQNKQKNTTTEMMLEDHNLTQTNSDRLKLTQTDLNLLKLT